MKSSRINIIHNNLLTSRAVCERPIKVIGETIRSYNIFKSKKTKSNIW